MYVERVLSLNDGWSILTTQQASEWQEALAAFEEMDEEIIQNSTRDSEGAPIEVEYVYSILYHRYQDYLVGGEYKWPHDTLPRNGKIALYSNSPLIKNGLLASMMGKDDITGGDFASCIYLYVPYYFSLGIINVAVYFVPSDEAIIRLINLGAKADLFSIPTEEFCRAEMTKLRALTNQAPIVLAFFSPTAPEEIVVEEVVPLKVGGHTIERTLEFAPEFYQASVGLLAHFGEVLRQKDPGTKAKVLIEQDGNTVRLRIVPPIGEAEVIEKQLEQFALVISNQAPPETLLKNRAHIMQLENQLDIARMQVKMAQDLKQLSDGLHTQRINNLEQQVDFLKNQVATQLLQTGQVIQLATQQAGSHERMQAALLAHGQMLFKDLLKESRGNFHLLEAIQSLHQNLLSGLTTIDVEDQIKRSLETVKQQKSGMLTRIYSQVEGAALKAGAGASLTWATELIKPYLHTT